MLWSWRSGHCSDKRESFPGIGYIAIALALGFVAYGLSDMYVRAQNPWSRAKTSAYYAVVNSLIGALLAFAFANPILDVCDRLDRDGLCSGL